ncbi:glycosyltransferase family 2 protein [Flavobacteriaceae bacterium XHP0103]|uniref:glycosyltransferase family 2 protein n=1 Tax=Marixanthotalea marina TaxID=2844359 RepID=UPI002989DC16|nr:glycosyltransferase family 2 protein [Marixanthotalea marina]MBU3820658.1 glycosyltransferase family 2 protein [Marixanthotalea marina]
MESFQSKIEKELAKVYIILVNYKSWNDTIECLESVLKSSYQNFQIIIVDNSPTDESIHQLSAWNLGEFENISTNFEELVFPLESKPLPNILVSEEDLKKGEVFDQKILIVKARENKGFSAANNIALKYVKNVADNEARIWLLNNDTVVPKNTLSQLLFETYKTKRPGIVGSMLLEYYEPNEIQAIGGKYNPWIGRIKLVGKGKRKNLKKVKYDYPIGASMFLTFNFLKDVGLMEESYFLYFEEYDWVIRGNKEGYTSYVLLDTIVYHKGGSSTEGSTSKIVDFYGIRSKILFTRKFFPFLLPLLYLSFTVFLFNRISRRQLDRIPMVFKLIINPTLTYNEAIRK